MSRPRPASATAPADLFSTVGAALYPLQPLPSLPGANRDGFEDLIPDRLFPAAVLVPLVARRDGLQVLLTRRHQGLRHHAGQVSFPGGRIEPGDSGPVAAALREAHEEVGLEPGDAEPLGLLDPLVTISAFHVWPVVARVDACFEALIDRREVDAAFEVPLEFLLDPRNCSRAGAEFGGRMRYWSEFRYEGHRIWGATAAMLVNLRDRMQAEA